MAENKRKTHGKKLGKKAATDQKAKIGRPRRAAEVAGKTLGVRLTAGEWAALELAAGEASVSEWARKVLLLTAAMIGQPEES